MLSKKSPRGRFGHTLNSQNSSAILIPNAVANACGANPYPIIIPCHRVIRSDGSIGGYSGEGGVETKRKLLSEEGVTVGF